jgi:FlaA1/EpsC-like NDP-sugar epimerase
MTTGLEFYSLVRNHRITRFGIKVAVDACLTLLACTLAVLCLDGFSQPGFHPYLTQWLLIALLINLFFQLPRQHYRMFGRRDLFRLAVATGALIVCAMGLPHHGVLKNADYKFGIVLIAGLLTGLFWLVFRLCVAEFYDRRSAFQHASSLYPQKIDRVLIMGAGRAGLLVVNELSLHAELGYKVIGFVDDASEKRSIRIQGTPVLGTSRELPELLKKHQITLVILAIPSAPGPVIRQLAKTISLAGARVKTVPGIFNLLGSQPWAPKIQDVAIEDLLRREPVQLDQTALKLVIEDSVVLITGGGGSIGSEIARQIAAYRPARIVLLGRGENSLWKTEREMRRLFPNQPLSLELCDIRNPQRLQQAFRKWKPELVFHAAAHKHVPFLEMHPSEGILNNVLGTQNVVREAQAVGAHTLVNISTDKAVNPTNVLGATKFLAECIVLEAAATSFINQRFINVRFGNVLGSRGSVIPIFRDQIKRGGPLTVTHPDMTRFFMTIPEASQLVLQAGVLGGNGKIFVLDMGDPVKIADLATDMARLSGLTVGRDIDIQFTGIRPGEKLFEETFNEHEKLPSEVHPKVFEGNRLPPDSKCLQQTLDALTAALALPEGDYQREILRLLKLAVPTYHPSPTGLGRYEKDAEERRTANVISRATSTLL